MNRFSAVGYCFGNKLQNYLGVPVGLINSSWGGTPAGVWTPQIVIEENPVLSNANKRLKPSSGWPIAPGSVYNAMIHPIVNFAIRGAIWYQGESNVSEASSYRLLFTSMIESWRSAWHSEFPFYYVQIAPFAGYGKGNAAALLREAQTKSLSCPRTGMVVISDLVDNINDIHPKLKKEVGLRLANYALAETYGMTGRDFKSPMYKSITIDKDKIRVFFDNADNGLITKKGKAEGFYIAGEDQKFYPASAKIDGSSVILSSKNVKKPVAVRFGFTNDAMPDLFSKDGLPVNSFRTDAWDVNTQ
jgi:sialate O-acetylesterase